MLRSTIPHLLGVGSEIRGRLRYAGQAQTHNPHAIRTELGSQLACLQLSGL
jgi:hypothetical protein